MSSDHLALQSQNAALEAMVADRTRELASAVRELESFTYSVAHDLRAPLRAINSFSRALVEDHADALSAEPLDYLQRIVRASQRMSLLIDDLLKLSRVGRGDVERRPIDLTAMLGEIEQTLIERHPGRHVTLRRQPGMRMQGDARLLAIAIENVLDNAWKFTRHAPDAVITCTETLQDGRRILHVADNGVGFDMRYRHKLFAPFQRLHRDDEFEGTGIGLVTVARIAARHGGEVAITGAEGVGTTVSLSLPWETDDSR
jgi:light-regulated signal transduction histidine kinase (bacteriophytochrome)